MYWFGHGFGFGSCGGGSVMFSFFPFCFFLFFFVWVGSGLVWFWLRGVSRMVYISFWCVGRLLFFLSFFLFSGISFYVRLTCFLGWWFVGVFARMMAFFSYDCTE